MNIPTYLSSTLKSYPIISILIKLVCFYVFIRFLIYIYVGISTPGGDVSSVFFEKIYLIPHYITCILIPIQWGYELFGYDITPIHNGMLVLGQGGIIVEFPCIGLSIAAAWLALILAFPGKEKITFVLLGLFFIHLLNTIRIAAVFYADITFQNKNYVALSHDLYNYIGYAMIIGLFYIWRERN